MSNYTIENLISATAGSGRVPAIKVGGQVFPMQMSGTSGMDFYKCASVTSGGSTWTGYKAVLSDGVYSFESTVTSGLTYGDDTPTVGKIYSNGLLVEVAYLYTGIPSNGLLVYITGNSLTTAETGQTLHKNGNVDLYNDATIGSCLNFYIPDGSSYGGMIDCSTNISSSSSPWTMSLWLKRNGEYTGTDWPSSGAIFNFDNNLYFIVNNANVWLFDGSSESQTTALDTTVWNHLCLNYDSGIFKLYINGVLANTLTWTQNNSKQSVYFGRHATIGDVLCLRAYLKGIRLYDRTLTGSEISALAAEFTPGAS